MGSFAPQTVYSNNPSPQTGAGLAALASNLEAVKELPGAQAPQSVSIADNALTFSVGTGGVAAVSAYLIVDTEGQAAADDLTVINPVLSATDNLHDGMLLFLQAADQSRVVTVRNSSSANGILTADGEDVALTADAWYCLQLRQGTWREVQGLREASALTAANSSRRNIGELVHSLVPLDDASLHLLDGTLLAADGMYAAGIAKIVALQTDYSGLFVTEADWQASVTAYGVCGKFVYDATAGTLRLPKVTGFLEATIDATALGDLVEAGLPDHSHIYYRSGSRQLYRTDSSSAAAFGGENIATGFASASNPIYGNSATVQPQSIKGFVYMVLANTVKAPVVVDAEQYANDVNALAGDVATRTTAAGAAHAAMPSGQYIDLTLPASGGTVTAPADGWVFLRKTGANQTFVAIQIQDASNSNAIIFESIVQSSTANSVAPLSLCVPVRSGDTIYVSYSAAGATSFFRFIYANGTAPTA